MANQNSAKGNPASKRMMNPKRKEKRARSWAKRQKEKAANIAANRAAFEANEVYRQAGLPTPYEVRQRERRTR